MSASALVGNLGFTAERASRRSPGRQVMLCAVVLMTARRTVSSHSRPSSRCSDKETYLPVGRYRVPDRLTAPSLARFATTASGSARGNTRLTRAFRDTPGPASGSALGAPLASRNLGSRYQCESTCEWSSEVSPARRLGRGGGIALRQARANCCDSCAGDAPLDMSTWASRSRTARVDAPAGKPPGREEPARFMDAHAPCSKGSTLFSGAACGSWGSA